MKCIVYCNEYGRKKLNMIENNDRLGEYCLIKIESEEKDYCITELFCTLVGMIFF